MPRLSSRDQTAFSGIKRLCHGGLGSAELREAVGDRLRRHLKADFLAFVAADPATALPVHAVHDPRPGQCQAAEEKALIVSPAFDYGRHVRSGRRVFRVDELAALGRGEQDPYLREVLLAYGLRHELQLHCVAAARVWGGLHLGRRLGRDAFEARDLHFLDLVAPHVTAGLRAAASRAALAAAPGSGVGLVVIGPDGGIELVNEVAERFVSGGAMRAVESRWSAIWTVAGLLSREAHEDRRVPALTLVDEEFGEAYRVRAERTVAADGRPRRLVFIEPRRAADHADALLALGLTGREAEVALAVVRGNTTAQIAAALAISPHTVQDHLRRTFEKLGVGSRRALAALLLGASAGPSAH